MKAIYLFFCLSILFIYGCDEDSSDLSDAGITTEATETYFGFKDNKTITYEGTQTVNGNTAPITFDVSINVDSQTFGRKTFKMTWRSSIGVPFEEWFEIKQDSLFKVAQRYTENNQEKVLIFKTPVLFGKNPLKDGDNLKTEVEGKTYSYIISNYNYKTFKNDFGEVKRIIGSEDGASNEYYLKENEGFVGFRFNNHKGLYTIDVEMKK